MDLQTVYYHSIRQQIRRVLTAMGPARVDKGLTAFDDGRSNWSECFFARAYKGEADLNSGSPEQQLMQLLGIPSVVPIRIVYNAFDGNNRLITKDELNKFVHDVQLDGYEKSADDFLKSIGFSKAAEETPVVMACGV